MGEFGVWVWEYLGFGFGGSDTRGACIAAARNLSSGLGFRVQGSGYRVWCVWFGVQGLWFGV